ncbi:MAG: FAD:protein FMN transferase [Zoogloeaceae bacterium]|nr:FAD:protein FMN transferase [Zoogloeaceae bacterium]
MFRFFLCTAALLLAACQPAPPSPVRQESFVFGTRVEIQVAEADKAKAEAAAAAILKEFDRLNRVYHAWQPSQLTALNAAIAAGKSLAVTPEMADFIREAQTLAAQGGYRFDPGIGRLIQLWGFQGEDFQARLPDPETLADWRGHPASIAALAIDDNTVSSRDPRVALDFGGYLKGAALDRAAEILKARHLDNALINIGGNILALGSKFGTPWKVGIQHPREPGALAVLELRDGEAIGTSGDYQRYFELAGKRYCHLLDPATAAPVHHTQAVTLLIPPGTRAGTRSDALSKPLFLAGAAGWRKVAADMGLTRILRVDASGEIEVTPQFQARLTFIGTADVRVVH